MKLSLAMIVKNEAAVLNRILDSVTSFCDEIVIVDTGSQDNTVEIAAQYTQKIFSFPWCDDFAKARNFAFAKATGDLLMWLDGDDYVPPSSANAILALKEHFPRGVAAIYLPYHTAFDESDNPTFTFLRERIVKRDAAPRWVGRVHETLAFTGKGQPLDAPIHHLSQKTAYTKRNLLIYENMVKEHIPLSPRDTYYYGRELYYHRLYPQATDRLTAFLEAPDGWVEDKVDAARILSRIKAESKDLRGAWSALMEALYWAPLRPDVCYEAGKLLLSHGKYREAASWLECATALPLPQNGFVDTQINTYLPFMELCVVYDRLGEYEKAYGYHQKARAIRPKSPGVLHNQQYFESLGLAPKSQ